MEIKRIRSAGSLTLERSDLHVMDDTSRIAIVNYWKTDANLREVENASDIGANKIRYQFGNHLGSSSLELNDSGELISYEEYFPFGGTSFTTGNNQKEVKLKEYRYTGKERDNTTGLYYYGARYYAPWIGRWLSCDPKVEDGLNLYVYVSNSPIRFNDPDGQEEKDSIYNIKPQPLGLSTTAVDIGPTPQPKKPREQMVLGVLYGKSVTMPASKYDQAKRAEYFETQMVQFMNPFGAIGYLGAAVITKDPQKRLAASQVGSAVFGLIPAVGAYRQRAQQKQAVQNYNLRPEPTYEVLKPKVAPAPKRSYPPGYTDKPQELRLSDLPLRPVGSNVYSISIRVQLEKGKFYPGVSDYKQFQEANRQLHLVFQKDPKFANMMEKLFPGIIKGVQPGSRGAHSGTAPTKDVTWHHNYYIEGALDLVIQSQHKSEGPIQQTLHPGGKGGQHRWGGGRKRRILD